MVVCSITVHGLSIPLGKLGFYLPRTISRATSSDVDEPAPFHIREHIADEERTVEAGLRHHGQGSHPEAGKSDTGPSRFAGFPIPRILSRFGGAVKRDIEVDGTRHGEPDESPQGQVKEKTAEEDSGEGSRGVTPNETSNPVSKEADPPGAMHRRGDSISPTNPTSARTPTRDIRFGDEMSG